MAKFARMLLNKGKGRHEQIISSFSYDLMTKPYAAVDEDWSYGYGLYIFEYEGYAHIGHSGDMPGYEAYFWLDVDNGLAASILETQPPCPRISLPILNHFRAISLNQPTPELFPPRDPTKLDYNASGYAGVFTRMEDLFAPNPEKLNSAEIESEAKPIQEITFTALKDQLFLEYTDSRIVLEERGADCFYANHPEFNRFLLRFGREELEQFDSKVVEVFYGMDWFTNANYGGPTHFEIPQAWKAYIGHYRTHSPWENNNLRVILRKGDLLLVYPEGREEKLISKAERTFRIGEDEGSPEFLKFDQIAAGQALRANFSGCYFYRFFTP
jgi:hypothetical protein